MHKINFETPLKTDVEGFVDLNNLKSLRFEIKWKFLIKAGKATL